jgi:hypothetical protein
MSSRLRLVLLALLLPACATAAAPAVAPRVATHAPAPPVEAATLPHYPRPDFRPGGDDAELIYVVYGRFDLTTLDVRAREYHAAGLPGDLKPMLLGLDDELCALGLGPEMKAFSRLTPAEDAAMRAAPACVVLFGHVHDPADLDYLRDVVGIVMALAERGGVAVLDAGMFELFSPAEFRARVFDHVGEAWRFVSILMTPEENLAGSVWLHTRGMRHFGRPDLSVHGVIVDHLEAETALVNDLIVRLASGEQLADGQSVSVPGAAYQVKRMGDLEDTDFDNAHYELTRAGAR